MSWENTITIEHFRDHLNAAMDECDSVGLSAFRKKYGFYVAKNLHMYSSSGRGPYEARPLIAAAYLNAGGYLLTSSKDFWHNDGHEFLEKRFNFKAIKKTHSSR